MSSLNSLNSSSSSFGSGTNISDSLRSSSSSATSEAGQPLVTGKAPERPTNPPANTTQDTPSSKKLSLLIRINAAIQRFDAWPYETGAFETSKKDAIIYQPGHNAAERKVAAQIKTNPDVEWDPKIAKRNVNRPTSKLGCFGFELLKLAKDMILLGPRLAAGALGAAAGLTMLGGALVAAPFSREWKGRLMLHGMNIGSLSLLTGMMAIGRIAFSVADLAKPLTNRDVTIYALGKVTKEVFVPIQDLNSAAAMKISFSAKPLSSGSFNPSGFENPSDEIDELDDPELDKQIAENEWKEKLELNETAKKIIGIFPALSGGYIALASAKPESVSDLSDRKIG